MIIYYDEIELIKTGLIKRYDSERNTRNLSTAKPIRFVKTPEHYADLVEIVTDVLKYLDKGRLNKSFLGSPGTRFFRKIFTDSNPTISCHEANINSCYLFAFGMTRQEYWNPQSRLLEKKFNINLSNRSDIDAVYKLNTMIYEGFDVISFETLLEWHEKNPASIHTIKDQFGKIAGNINILPLKNEAIDFFLSGDLMSSDFRGKHLFAPFERNKVEYLYIESIINMASSEVLIEFLRNLPLILTRCCGDINNIKKVYCLALSADAKHLMHTLKFIKYENNGILRRDSNEDNIYYANIKDILIEVANLFRNNLKYETSYKAILFLLGTFKM